MAANTERIYRLGCFTIKEKPARSAQERQVARLLKGANSDISQLPNIIERDARSIADAMASLHGGEWSVEINHESCFVAVSRDFE